MSVRVCIPTAGTGSRLGELTRFVNKSLVGIANRPILCHLIEQFPADAEFVLVLGHKGHLVREFLELAYPLRRFFFSNVALFEGSGSGLGLSLLSCRQHLQQPFIFISCDTLVRETIPAPDENWMGYSDDADLEAYRTLRVGAGTVEAICEKGEGNSATHKAYIGLAGIQDYEAFWSAMMRGGEEAVRSGEAYGLRGLSSSKIRALRFTWYDTGNTAALEQARKTYQEPNSPNILEKANEAIWFVDKHVIKFSDDDAFIERRVARAKGLRGFVPEVTGATRHMYRYARADGQILSDVVTLPLFDRLLNNCDKFWQPRALQGNEGTAFRNACMRFYRDKTLERIELFYKNFARQDGVETINDVPMPKLSALLDALDWDWLADGMPGRFHGDFHFENILWSVHEQRFIFLDWRQDFGGSLAIGDIYYDLAKLLHGLIISHELIAKELFRISWKQAEITYDFHRKQVLVECERHFGKWLEPEGYDRKKVRVLTSLVFLNIAALHHYPYSLLLFALGKAMLKDGVEKLDAIN